MTAGGTERKGIAPAKARVAIALLGDAGASRRRPRLSPGRRTSKRQLEARRQRQTAGHLAHFLVADAVGLVARVVEGGGKQVLEHLLFGRDHQAVVNGDRLDARSEEHTSELQS